MTYRQEIWGTFIHVPTTTALPEFLQKIADIGKGQAKSTEDPEEVMKKARPLALSILSEAVGAPWNMDKLEEFQLEKLSGGFTNLTFKCSLATGKPVILKVEFRKSPEDKQREYGMVRLMAENGLGPKLLGTYPEGRIEEMLDCRIITEEELKDPRFSYELGRKLAQIHCLPIGDSPQNEIVTVMKGWIQRIRKSGQNSFELQPDMPLDPESYPRFVTTEMLEGEIEIIDRYLRDKFPSPVQMIHNDIFMPNILITSKTEPEKSLVLIDYEFSMKTHRAFDFVAYCKDFADNLQVDISKTAFPAHTAFARGYAEKIYEDPSSLSKLKLSGELEKDVQQLLDDCETFFPIWALYWAVWHVVCFVEGNTQLDYEKIYGDRVAAYYALKKF